MVDQSLPDAELDVLSCLWQGEPQTARQIRETLAHRRPLAHASICTLLGRLEEKGLVRREKAPTGKAFLYHSTVPPEKTKRRLARDLMDRVFGGNGVQLMASLFEGRRPTKDEIGQLESLLSHLRGEEADQRGGKKRKGEIMNAVVNAWGFWLFHAAWQAAFVAAVILLVVWLGRRWPAPIRYGLLLVALAKFALPPIVALPTSVLHSLGARSPSKRAGAHESGCGRPAANRVRASEGSGPDFRGCRGLPSKCYRSCRTRRNALCNDSSNDSPAKAALELAVRSPSSPYLGHGPRCPVACRSMGTIAEPARLGEDPVGNTDPESLCATCRAVANTTCRPLACWTRGHGAMLLRTAASRGRCALHLGPHTVRRSRSGARPRIGPPPPR